MSSVTNIKFINADILTCLFEPNSFDFIVSIATFHHFGTLIILDIHEIVDSILRNAIIRRHLFWRYSLTWKKEV
ncbi:class I SAM-dependent methyltransferase [Chengkuizengella axinellae]|uniref:class I SAM-dependent methyltransferase n=1 Tax=Chengkuizengella axinellae TaxID=3064388 RepID=UPI0035297F18